MLLRAYGPYLFQTLLAAVCVAAGILTFGNALYFDRLFFGALLLVAAVCYRNINILGIVLIIVLERLLEEAIWAWVKDLAVANVLIYGFAVFVLYLCRYEPLAKYMGAVLLIAIGTELYWMTTQHSAPLLHWYMAMVTLNMLTRYLLTWRAPITEQLLSVEATPILADWRLSDIAALCAAIQATVLIEFVLRHLVPVPDLLYAYHAMPYLMHSLACLTLWVILNQSVQLHLHRLIKA